MYRRTLALLAALSFSVPLVALAATAPPADIAGKVQAFYKERPTVRAQFVQKVQKPGRRRILEKSGNVFFSRPGKMRWEYKSPETVFYVSDGKVLWSFQVEDKLVTRLDVASSELYHQSRYLFGQGNLVEDFTLSEGAARTDGLFPLVLTPKQNARDFKSLTLLVQPASGEIKQTVLVDPYDNVSTIEFVRVDFQAVDDTLFSFTPPTDATVRDLSKETPK